MDSADRPTLAHVARRAAVSRQTVSNVLNAPHLVRQETAARVQEAIDALGYRPHAAARQLRTRRSQALGLRIDPVGDGINGAVLDRFLHALTERAQSRGYRIVLFTASDDRREIEQYGELLDTADLDGFVLTGTHHGDPRTRWLAERAVPFVTFGRPWAPAGEASPDHPWVDVDGAAGTRAATEHLLALGHSRIGLLGWPQDSDLGEDRARGWHATMRRAGVPHDVLATWAAHGIDDVGGAARAAAELLAHQDLTALVCVSDSLALGALAAARALGRDCAVVGFDDTPVAAALGLTSVAQPLAEAADRAFGLLLRRLQGGDGPVPEPHVLLAPALVARASSTPPPS